MDIKEEKEESERGNVNNKDFNSISFILTASIFISISVTPSPLSLFLSSAFDITLREDEGPRMM